MINKRINGNKYIRKKIGGADSDTEYDIKNNIYVLYNLFSYLLLYISYILFGIATIIFLNACLNFKKAKYDNYEKDKDGIPIFLDKPIFLDQPIFEYLKTNNFMYIDDYLLNKDSAIFIAIISIFSISITATIIILLIVKYLNIKDERMYITNILEEFKKNQLYILALIPYIFILIIIIIYNENKKSNKKSLNDNEYNTKKINYSIYDGEYPETYLRNLKNKIINILENDNSKNYITNASTGLAFFDDKDKTQFRDIIKDDKKFGEVDEDSDQNILKMLFITYKDGHDAISTNAISTNDKDKIKRLKDYKIKYIKHINDYFELLIRDKINKNDDKDDFYKKYYIFGLANKFPTIDLNTNFNDLNTKFNDLLVEIAKKVNAYYIVIFTFYPLLFLIIAPIIIYKYNEDKTTNFIIDSLYYFNINFQKISLIFCIIAFISYFIFYYNKSV